jgi:two-component system response regulator YesN
VHDMNSWLRRKLFELSERLYIKNQKQNRKIIDAIREYIDLQLTSKITLKQVAGHFSFSPNYLGQLFKEETGEHFSNYLIRVRIKRACELLLNPLLKVYEIADQLGYKNILYFHRQFKQLTGVTPGDYRKANKI